MFIGNPFRELTAGVIASTHSCWSLSGDIKVVYKHVASLNALAGTIENNDGI